MTALLWFVAETAALLLVTSGVAKLRYPLGAARALLAASLPHSFRVVRSVGAVEVAVGAVAAVAPFRVAFVGVAAAYALFGAMLVYFLIGEVQLTSCGCAGKVDVPPSWLHAVLNYAAAVTAALNAFYGATLPNVAAGARGYATTFVFTLPMSAYLIYLVVLRSHGPLTIPRRSRATGDDLTFRLYTPKGGDGA
jgi:hypothetical protein